LTVDIFGCVKNLIEVIRADLHQRGGEGVAETLSRLAEQDISDQSFVMPGSQLQPVCIFVPHVIFAISHLNVNLASATAEISDHLRWVQSASYTDAALGEGFSKNYAWCELIGPQGFFKGSDFLLGFLLLGPHRHYKDHYHPAPELYWPLTAPSDWKKGDGHFTPRQAGEIIWHPSTITHATITHDKPLLAVYAWTRDVEIGARLVDGI
jgi:Dimethlysulfonioproprionate lyase